MKTSQFIQHARVAEIADVLEFLKIYMISRNVSVLKIEKKCKITPP